MGYDEAPAPGARDPRAYTKTERDALSLAGELRERVRRERATIANLRAYLTRRDSSR